MNVGWLDGKMCSLFRKADQMKLPDPFSGRSQMDGMEIKRNSNNQIRSIGFRYPRCSNPKRSEEKPDTDIQMRELMEHLDHFSCLFDTIIWWLQVRFVSFDSIDLLLPS